MIVEVIFILLLYYFSFVYVSGFVIGVGVFVSSSMFYMSLLVIVGMFGFF